MMIRNRPGTTSKIRPCQARETHSTASSSNICPARVLNTNDAARNDAKPSTLAADGPSPATRASAQSSVVTKPGFSKYRQAAIATALVSNRRKSG